MSRRARFDYVTPERPSPKPVPANVAAKLRRALSDFSEESIDAFIEQTPYVVADCKYLIDLNRESPTRANKAAAADAIRADVVALQQKLVACGGAADAIDTVLIEEGYRQLTRPSLMASLANFAECAGLAARQIEDSTSAWEQQFEVSARQKIAERLVETYTICFEERPSSTVSRPSSGVNVSDSPFVAVLKILISHCEGRPIYTSVEPIARKAIKHGAFGTACLFERYGPHRVPNK